VRLALLVAFLGCARWYLWQPSAVSVIISRPFLSVIIPTFRKPEALARCLAGFANQSLDHALFNLVVVDDAFDPLTVQVVEHFVDRVNLVMIQHKSNAGVGAARQTGFYLCILGNDVQ
jgi:glycosyltransferase involved in cell wall biosynthesis